eukprot:4112162-Pleurochrysis_carterae.AAC.4
MREWEQREKEPQRGQRCSDGGERDTNAAAALKLAPKSKQHRSTTVFVAAACNAQLLASVAQTGAS